MTKIVSIMIYVIGIYLLVSSNNVYFSKITIIPTIKRKLDPFFYSNTGLKKVNLKTSDGLVLSALFRKPSSKNKIL